jgi:hypothetical protein
MKPPPEGPEMKRSIVAPKAWLVVDSRTLIGP